MRVTSEIGLKVVIWSALAGVCRILAAEAIQPGEAALLSNVRQLTFEGKRSGEGYFSPDGKALIFQSEREPDNPFYQIYILSLETGESHRVSPGSGKTTCAFFRPGSDEVLYASTHLDPEAKAKQKAEFDFRSSGKQRRYSWDYDEQMDIFSARRDGGELRRLTETFGYDAEAAYSPDGRKIVFTSLRDTYPRDKLSPEDRKRLDTDPSYFGEIYIMNAGGSEQRRLTVSPGYDGGPFFSPDGQRIVWRRFDEKGTVANVFTMELGGTDVRQVTDFGCMAWAPFFHPSGKYIIFTANKQGFSNFELFIVDAAGQREPVRVTHADGFDGLPSFSPNGTRLCWTSNRTSESNSQLFLADWNHEAATAALTKAPVRTDRGVVDGVSGVPEPSVGGQRAAGPTSSGAEGARWNLSVEITKEDLRAEVAYLASDALEGRMTGSEGARKAADFIAEQLKQAGLTPPAKEGSYFQPFEFTSGVRVITNENRLTVLRQDASAQSVAFTVEKDFRPLSFTMNGAVEGDVVFAGYGLSIPGKPGEGYDSYRGLDVTNTIVLILRYVPENVETKRRQELNRYANPRYKAMLARERGAKAILMVTGPNSPNAGQLAPLSFDTSLAGSGIVAASITTNLAAALLADTGKDLGALQTALDTENPHAETGLLLPGVTVKLATAVEHIRKTDRNVIGYLPPASGNTRHECVLIGAHYDHLGFGESGAMLRQGEERAVHNGADDNASGVAAVLELAAALSGERKQRPEAFDRGILFALWSGEELGLIGSSHFVEHPPVALSNLVAYLNFDMVGRLRDNKLTLQGIDSSSTWRKLIEKRNVAAGFDLNLQGDPYLPTDVTAVYPKRIPVLNFFTGSHEDYHRPTDDTETLNYQGLERITEFARSLILDLVRAAERPAYAQVERSSASGGGSRDALRAYLGTIPDYTTEVTGVKLSGVRGGSPAEKAGLKSGDIIVEFGDQQIKNIYDYTYALDAVKIGQPVKIVIQRAGQRETLTVTPAARK